jgi:acetyltransferase-like isoleucine patch superfamily enzyme
MSILTEFISLPKKLYWDMAWKQGRYEYINWIIGNIPGHFGCNIRKLISTRFFKNAGENISVFPGVKIRGIHNLTVGNNVILGEDIFINANGGITIEDEAGIGPGTKIWSVNHVFSDLNIPITQQGYEDKPVFIGKGVWIGANCTILPGAFISEGAVISAGSVVGGKKVKPFSILAGNPARYIGTRVEDQK